MLNQLSKQTNTPIKMSLFVGNLQALLVEKSDSMIDRS